MAKRVAVTALNASTLTILNTIRQNASLEYQSLVPEVTQATDIPKVGEVLMGYPALANQFINALLNRIALVRVKSATFNNEYADLKKGYLEYGETVEEAFVNITKAREFSAEKAEARELKRSLPDVRTAFHTMNYRVQYPITIQNEDLRMAFTSIGGVEDMIARIVGAVNTAAEYDEFLLFKYLMIKAITHGKMYPIGVDVSDIKNAAVAFRGTSNLLPFMSTKYNAAGVTTATPKADQYIFMDAQFNAQYDVNVLASAFNMDKADFMGRLKLIDDWTTFDNDRFSVVMAGSDQIEEVTAAELAIMANVKAVLVDREWFQIYDNLSNMSEKYVASGLYWNYFYNVWKTVSSSPFSNAIVFVDSSAAPSNPATLTVTVASKDVSADGIAIALHVNDATAGLADTTPEFVQTQALTTNAIAVEKYGALLVPDNKKTTDITLVAKLGSDTYTASSTFKASTVAVGATVSLAKA